MICEDCAGLGVAFRDLPCENPNCMLRFSAAADRRPKHAPAQQEEEHKQEDGVGPDGSGTTGGAGPA